MVDLFRKLRDQIINRLKQIIIDLETIIKYQNSLIVTLDKTLDAYCYRMHWYNDFINDYDSQLLEISKTLESKDKKDIAKKVKKIKGKIRDLLPKTERRYGKLKSK